MKLWYYKSSNFGKKQMRLCLFCTKNLKNDERLKTMTAEPLTEYDFKKQLGKNLTFLRTRAGMTQSQVAEALNYSDKSVSKWERGDGMPDLYILSKLAKLYEVDVDAFLASDPAQLEPPPAETPEEIRYRKKKHLIIPMLSIGIVWLSAVILFVLVNIVTDLLHVDFRGEWLVFIYALPAMAIVSIVFSKLWWNRVTTFLAVTMLVWTVPLCIHMTVIVFLGSSSGFELFYIISAVLEVMTILWFLMKRPKKKKDAAAPKQKTETEKE